MEIYLGTVKRAVALVYHIIETYIFERGLKAVCRKFPILVASHTVLRPGRQLDVVFESEYLVHLVDKTDNAFYLVGDLLRGHEDMRVVLSETANAHKSVERARFLVSVHDAQLAHTHRQIAVGVRRRVIHQQSARAVHRLYRKLGLVDDRRIHIILIVIPMPRGLPETSFQDYRRGYFHIALAVVDLSPEVRKRVLKDHAFRQEERESRTLVHDREQTQLLAEPAVVALLSLFYPLEIRVELRLFGERRAVDPGQHLVLFAAAPIRARGILKLYRL